MPDVLEQLRQYGEAVELEALSVGPQELVLDPPWWRRGPAVLLAAALVAAVLAVGGVALRLALVDARVKVVATVPTTPSSPRSTEPPPDNPTTSQPEDASATTTTSPDASSTTTTSTSARPAPRGVAPVTTTTSAASSAAPTTATTSPVWTENTTTTIGTSATPRLATVRGTATWVGGRDPRATLRVAACPVGNTETGCGTAGKVIDVAADGSFQLLLPTEDSPRDWNVAALVSHGQYDCAFNCYWRVSQAGRPTTISDAAPPPSLDLSVAARVVDVFVRDRNNQPFAGGGAFVRDIRCPEHPCPSDQASMYSQASSTDGAARIVVDPAQTYDFFGMAQNTGWPNPQYTNSDGSTSWHSPTIRRKGSDITEGYVFLVNGAPA